MSPDPTDPGNPCLAVTLTAVEPYLEPGADSLFGRLIRDGYMRDAPGQSLVGGLTATIDAERAAATRLRAALTLADARAEQAEAGLAVLNAGIDADAGRWDRLHERLEEAEAGAAALRAEVARLRALVEASFREGQESASWSSAVRTPPLRWLASDAKKALEALDVR